MGAPKPLARARRRAADRAAARGGARPPGWSAVVVAKAGTPLPDGLTVWLEPDEPFHPLLGVVTALEHAGGPVVAVACDQPFVPRRAAGATGGGPEAAVAIARPDRAVPGPLRAGLAARPARRARARGAAAGDARGARAGDARVGRPGAAPEREHAGGPGGGAARRGVTDVAVIGGGIVGCALAAFLAEAGAAVTLYEREAIAAGASGRNSGVVQHPIDPALVGALRGVARALPRARARLRAAGRAGRRADRLRGRQPARGLRGGRGALPRARARVARGRRAARCRARAGRGPVRVPPRHRPADRADRRRRTRARRGRARPARGSCVGETARVAPRRRPTPTARRHAGRRGRGRGRPVDARGGRRRRALATRSAAAGASSPRCGCADPPRHAIEEAGVEALTEPGGAPPSLFSIVTTGGGLGRRLDVHDRRAGRRPRWRRSLLERGARYIPALAASDDRARPRLRAAAGGRRAPAAGRDRPRACTWSPATARGASRSGRGRRGWWRGRCWAPATTSRRS